MASMCISSIFNSKATNRIYMAQHMVLWRVKNSRAFKFNVAQINRSLERGTSVTRATSTSLERPAGEALATVVLQSWLERDHGVTLAKSRAVCNFEASITTLDLAFNTLINCNSSP
jgi:hypothetical protein